MIALLRINGEFGSDVDQHAHISILDAIADRDGQTAAALARKHLLTLNGFDEAFRTPRNGTPIHVDLVLDGYRLGLATETSTREDHGRDPIADGQRAAVILWTDDVPTGYERLIDLGATPVKTPEPWLDRLLIAWVEDPDGHLVQVVQALR